MSASNSTSSENFAELFEASQKETQFRLGDTIYARVIGKRPDTANPDFILVDSGLKSESWIPAKEFLGEEVNVGDDVEVVVKKTENGFGETKLSHIEAKRARAWVMLEKQHDANENVTGTLLERVRGGFTVEVEGLPAFLPGSLVDSKLMREGGLPESKEIELKIIKIDQKRNNIVVSRRAVLDQLDSEQRQARIAELSEGQEIKGIVKSITPYGAFLDLGGIDGLLHITDISWSRIKHPQDILTVGQELVVKILKFDLEKKRISLGLKQLSEDPWVNIERRYTVGTHIYGAVTNVTDYGCFVQVESGVEGLVHMSEMDWTNRNVNPSKIVEVGQEIEVVVLDVSEKRRRISLGIKQTKENPWEQFASHYQKGDTLKCPVRSITDFGLFLGLPGEVDGLVRLIDISWHETGEQAVRHYKKGDEVEAVILNIDSERERISLSIKHREDNPKGKFAEEHADQVIDATINSVEAKQAQLQLADDITGVLRNTDYLDGVDDLTTVINTGDVIKVTVQFDVQSQDIHAAHKTAKSGDKTKSGAKAKAKSKEAKDTNAGKKATSKAKTSAGKSSSTVAKATLGDLLKEQMQQNKDQEK